MNEPKRELVGWYTAEDEGEEIIEEIRGDSAILFEISKGIDRLKVENADLTAQRDVLLEAVKFYMAGHPCSDKAETQCPSLIAAQAAIAMVEGER